MKRKAMCLLLAAVFSMQAIIPSAAYAQESETVEEVVEEDSSASLEADAPENEISDDSSADDITEESEDIEESSEQDSSVAEEISEETDVRAEDEVSEPLEESSDESEAEETIEEPVSEEGKSEEKASEDKSEIKLAEGENTLESEVLNERLLDAIRSNQMNVDISDLEIKIDLKDGKHILSDFQDDFLYIYAEDTFCIESMTFVQEDGVLQAIEFTYTDDFDTIEKMRAEISARINAILAEVEDIEDETEKIGEVAKQIWSHYYADFAHIERHGFDAYGALIDGYANSAGGASAFQAVMKRMGYEGSFRVTGARDIESATLFNGEWKFTSISNNQSRKANWRLLADGTFSTRKYTAEALTESRYSPVSYFSYNESASQYSENAQYCYEQVLQGAEQFVLPEKVYKHYKASHYFAIPWKHEYPEMQMLLDRNNSLRILSDEDGTITIQPTYVANTETRAEMLREYRERRDKIVERANEFESDEDKIIFVNNYLRKIAAYNEYDDDGNYLIHSHDAYGCLVLGECVCEGYATAFHDIMDQLGIENEYVQSYSHIWNKIPMDGEYKIVDVTYNGGGNAILLADDHDHNNWQNNSLRISTKTYVTKDCLSMKSPATLEIVQQIGEGAEYIDTSAMDFEYDSECLKTTIGERESNIDAKFYLANLQDIYPVETRDVEFIEFDAVGDKINGVRVTYMERNDEDTAGWDALLEEGVRLAEKENTEEAKVAAAAAYTMRLRTSENFEEGTLLNKLYKISSKAEPERTKFFCSILEKLGIRFAVVPDRNGYPFVITVYDGNVRYTTVAMTSRLDNVNIEKIKEYSKYKYNRVYDFRSQQGEYDYIDGISDSDTLVKEPVHVHTPGEAVRENESPATCKSVGGYDEVIRCTECGEIIESKHVEIPLADHKAGAAVHENEVPSSCKEAGSYDLVVRCTECGEIIESEHMELPLLAHIPGEVTYENEVPASCEKDGSCDKVVRCTECGEIIISTHVVIPATKHDWSAWQTTREATCTENGEQAKYCKKCGLGEGRDVPAKGHRPSDPKHENEVAATCEKAGGYDEVVRCTRCNEIINSAHVTVPAIGHEWGAWKVTKKPTTSVAGEEQRVCEHDPSHVEKRSIAKLKNIAKVTVTLSASSYTYNGKAKKPVPTVVLSKKTLVKDKDYTVSYSKNTNAGTATVKITGVGLYGGTVSKTFTISKAKQPMAVKVKTVSLKYSALKKAAQTIKASKSMTISGQQGKLAYAITSKGKLSGVKISKTSGAITVPKGTKKGTYKIKVKVTAAGNSNYKSGSKTVTIAIKVA